MVLPDLALICEIMLMAEGFQNSKLLSRKFIILYKLCEVRGACSMPSVGLAPAKSLLTPLLCTAQVLAADCVRVCTCPLPSHAGPAVQEQALRLEAARHQDDTVRGGRHEALRARAHRGQGGAWASCSSRVGPHQPLVLRVAVMSTCPGKPPLAGLVSLVSDQLLLAGASIKPHALPSTTTP